MGLNNASLDYDVYTSIVLRRHISFPLRAQVDSMPGHDKRQDPRMSDGGCSVTDVLEGARRRKCLLNSMKPLGFSHVFCV